jgi:hypothetical protein
MDIVIAFTLGGILLIIILNANSIAGDQASILNGDMLVQQMLISATQLIEGEFRNMGFGVHIDSAAVVDARDTALIFLSDLDQNPSTPLDTVAYYLGPLSELATTQNDSDRLLHRRINGGTPFSLAAVTQFRMKFFSQSQLDTILPPNIFRPDWWIIRRVGGVEVVPPALFDRRQIKIIEITMEVQNPYAIYKRLDDPTRTIRGALYSSSLWRQTRLASQNLRR